jgi:hypothetical protein
MAKRPADLRGNGDIVRNSGVIVSGPIEELLQNVQQLPDPQARHTALALAQAILDLHSAALERMLELIAEREPDTSLIDSIAADPEAGSVLLLHDLHPLELQARVERALENPSFQTPGSSVQLVSLRDGVVRIRVEGSPTLRSAVESAVWEAAPDAQDVILDGNPDFAGAGFVSVKQLFAG